MIEPLPLLLLPLHLGKRPCDAWLSLQSPVLDVEHCDKSTATADEIRNSLFGPCHRFILVGCIINGFHIFSHLCTRVLLFSHRSIAGGEEEGGGGYRVLCVMYTQVIIPGFHLLQLYYIVCLGKVLLPVTCNHAHLHSYNLNCLSDSKRVPMAYLLTLLLSNLPGRMQ